MTDFSSLTVGGTPQYLAECLRHVADLVEEQKLGKPFAKAIVILRHQDEPIGRQYGNVKCAYVTIDISTDEALAAFERVRAQMLQPSVPA